MNYPDNGAYMVVAYIIVGIVVVGYAAFLFLRLRKLQ